MRMTQLSTMTGAPGPSRAPLGSERAGGRPSVGAALLGAPGAGGRLTRRLLLGLARGGARGLGWGRWVVGEAIPLAITAGCVVFAALVVLEAFGTVPGKAIGFPLLVVLVVLLPLLMFMWRSRRRIVVAEFLAHHPASPDGAEHPGKGSGGRAGPIGGGGLGPLLVSELAAAGELLDTVDGQRATAVFSDDLHAHIGGDGAGSGIALRVVRDLPPINADSAAPLADTVSSERNIGFGPINLPLRAVTALLERLVGGPRLVASLHQKGDVAVMTARVTIAGRTHVWRVGDRPGAVTGKVVNEMLHELSMRIFADLALGGRVRWTAAESYLKGLKAYRRGLRAPTPIRRRNLDEACGLFAQAVERDQEFGDAYYNLGVVLAELEQLDRHDLPLAQAGTSPDPPRQSRLARAENSFVRAIKADPRHADAYLALAQIRLRMVEPTPLWWRELETIDRLCQRVEQLAPRTLLAARALRLAGIAQRLHEHCRRACHDSRGSESPAGDTRSAVSGPSPWMACRRRALAAAWKALCVSELRDRGRPEAQVVASACLRSLAVGLVPFDVRRSSEQIRTWMNVSLVLSDEGRRVLGTPTMTNARGMREIAKQAAHTRSDVWGMIDSLFEEAVKLTPGDGDLHRDLGRIRLLEKDLHSAANSFARAESIEPWEVSPWEELLAADATGSPSDSAGSAADGGARSWASVGMDPHDEADQRLRASGRQYRHPDANGARTRSHIERDVTDLVDARDWSGLVDWLRFEAGRADPSPGRLVEERIRSMLSSSPAPAADLVTHDGGDLEGLENLRAIAVELGLVPLRDAIDARAQKVIRELAILEGEQARRGGQPASPDNDPASEAADSDAAAADSGHTTAPG